MTQKKKNKKKKKKKKKKNKARLELLCICFTNTKAVDESSTGSRSRRRSDPKEERRSTCCPTTAAACMLHVTSPTASLFFCFLSIPRLHYFLFFMPLLLVSRNPPASPINWAGRWGRWEPLSLGRLRPSAIAIAEQPRLSSFTHTLDLSIHDPAALASALTALDQSP
jgi:hypothetical protein